MVAPHPELNRRLRNTDSIIKANRPERISTLHSKYPYDYIDIDTHKVIERVKPWVEIQSPIGIQCIQSSQSSQSSKSMQPFVTDKILVLCVDFNDKPAQISTETIYSRFFGNYTNSLKEYYKEVSYSKYIPDGEVHGWYRAPNPSTYYTNKENGFGKYPNSAEKLIEDVVDIALIDPDIDWLSFDTNDNGYIDNLIVVHSGAEASWTGDVNDFWAHVYIIPEPKIVEQQKLSKGRTIWVYALVSEYLDIPDNYRLVGIDTHEHAHQLGLPDLYDYTNQSSGVGYYSLMGSGSWSLKGMWPAHLDAWSKYVIGFADVTIDPIGTVYITNTETDSNIFKYTTDDPKQYFLVENRQKVLYDKYLPSEGMFIWRINENQIDNQMYNDDKSCYLVGLIQADNFNDLENRANNGDLGDPYPGITNNRSFGVNTNPNSMLCNKNIQNLLINNISDSVETMTFNSSI